MLEQSSAVFGGGGTAEEDPSAVTGGGVTIEQDGSAVTGGGGIAEQDGKAVTGGGGIAEQPGSAVIGGGGIIEQDGSAVTGGGGIIEHDGSAVTGGGGMLEQDSAVDGGGGITDPPSTASDPIPSWCACQPDSVTPRFRVTRPPASSCPRLMSRPPGDDYPRLGLWAVRHVLLTLLALTVFLGIFWVVNGFIELFTALSHRGLPQRGWTVVLGLLSVLAGIVVLSYPGLTLLGLATVLGIWLAIFGAIEITAAFRIRGLGRSASRTTRLRQHLTS